MLVVIPTEGSPAYGLARKISAERLWNRHFDAPYAEFYKREHINVVPEILAELVPTSPSRPGPFSARGPAHVLQSRHRSVARPRPQPTVTAAPTG